MKTVVVIGGGFGGVFTIKNLLKHKKFNVILISKTEYFTFMPLLPEAITGAIHFENVMAFYHEIFKSPNFSFIKSEVKKIDFDSKTIIHSKGRTNYDYLVIAIGATANLHSIPGANKHSIYASNYLDAIELRHEIMRECAKKHSTITLVGAGATGIEVSIELIQLIRQYKHDTKVNLVSNQSTLLPKIPNFSDYIKKILKENKINLIIGKATRINKKNIVVNGKKYDSNLTIWTGGHKPRLIQSKALHENNHLITNEFLQLKKMKNEFALGDCIQIEDTRYPYLAQTAVQQSKTVANNIIALEKNNRLTKFKYKEKGFLLSLGKWNGIGLVNKFNLKGKHVWILKHTVYASKLAGLKLKPTLFFKGIISIISPRRHELCKVEQELIKKLKNN